MSAAGVLVSAGAAMLLAKGLLLIATSHDRSLVPWFSLLSSVGLTLASVVLWRSVKWWRWLSLVGGLGAVVGAVWSLVAVVYLLTGTIPESPDAPNLVGVSYGVMSGGLFLALLSLGVLVAGNRSLSGGWRWFPAGLVLAQLPIFIVAGAVGDAIGSEDLTDGLGLALTGAVWMLLGYSLSKKQQLNALSIRT